MLTRAQAGKQFSEDIDYSPLLILYQNHFGNAMFVWQVNLAVLHEAQCNGSYLLILVILQILQTKVIFFRTNIKTFFCLRGVVTNRYSKPYDLLTFDSTFSVQHEESLNGLCKGQISREKLF